MSFFRLIHVSKTCETQNSCDNVKDGGHTYIMRLNIEYNFLHKKVVANI